MTSAYRVITLRKRWPKAPPSYFVYVGRKWAGLDEHPLANPFTTGDPVGQYREWLGKHPQLRQLMGQLRADTECGRVPLACWCGDGRTGDDLRCHAMVLADTLASWFPQDKEGMPW